MGKSNGSVSMEEFFKNFSEQEMQEIVFFLTEAVNLEKEKRPNRKNENAITIRILSFDQAMHDWNRYRAHNEDTLGDRRKDRIMLQYEVSTLNEVVTINALFHVFLFQKIGIDRVRELTEKYVGKRLYFSKDTWQKTIRKMAILDELSKGTPIYIIEKTFNVSADYIRHIKHRSD